MNKEMTSQAEADEEILTFNIPDAVLERAGSAEQKAFTLFYCTSPSYGCQRATVALALRQLGDIRRDPPRLIARKQFSH